jgi:hypothetical protein
LLFPPSRCCRLLLCCALSRFSVPPSLSSLPFSFCCLLFASLLRCLPSVLVFFAFPFSVHTTVPGPHRGRPPLPVVIETWPNLAQLGSSSKVSAYFGIEPLSFAPSRNGCSSLQGCYVVPSFWGRGPLGFPKWPSRPLTCRAALRGRLGTSARGNLRLITWLHLGRANVKKLTTSLPSSQLEAGR